MGCCPNILVARGRLGIVSLLCEPIRESSASGPDDAKPGVGRKLISRYGKTMQASLVSTDREVINL